MDKLSIYEISDRYISFLQSYKELTGIRNQALINYASKNYNPHTRKYLGVVLNIVNKNNMSICYFAPLSSKKKKDFIADENGNMITDADGNLIPRGDTITIIRLCNKTDVLGKILLNDMIPVPESELTKYDLKGESDKIYARKVKDEIRCIRAKQQKIISNANLLYRQKTDKVDLSFKYAYLKNTIPFKFAEEKYFSFIKQQQFSNSQSNVKNTPNN